MRSPFGESPVVSTSITTNRAAAAAGSGDEGTADAGVGAETGTPGVSFLLNSRSNSPIALPIDSRTPPETSIQSDARPSGLPNIMSDEPAIGATAAPGVVLSCALMQAESAGMAGPAAELRLHRRPLASRVKFQPA